MSVVVLCSANGAPGVTLTTLALGWVWPTVEAGRRSVVVDADAAGSGILPGYLNGDAPVGTGVLGLAAHPGPLTAQGILRQCLVLDPGQQRWLLTGVADPVQARSLVPVWRGLLDAVWDLDAEGLDLWVDCGRIGHRQEPTVLLEHADVVAVVARATLSSLVGAAAALRHLRELRGPARLTTAVLVGAGRPYPVDEVARELGAAPLPQMAWDRWTTRHLAEGGLFGTGVERLALLRSARATAVALRDASPAISRGART